MSARSWSMVRVSSRRRARARWWIRSRMGRYPIGGQVVGVEGGGAVGLCPPDDTALLETLPVPFGGVVGVGVDTQTPQPAGDLAGGEVPAAREDSAAALRAASGSRWLTPSTMTRARGADRYAPHAAPPTPRELSATATPTRRRYRRRDGSNTTPP